LMSVRESIELYCKLDLEKYLEILGNEYVAQRPPSQPDEFVVDDLQYYSPKHNNDHIAILGFSKIPLPYSFLQAFIDRPDLVPDEVLDCWTIEQELLLEVLIGELSNSSS